MLFKICKILQFWLYSICVLSYRFFMKNTLGKIVKAWKDTFDHLDSKINFSIPQNLVNYYGINGKKNDKDLQLTEDNFRLQIGKMEKNNETIYTKEILLPGLEYVLKKTWKDEKVIIQLRPDLAKFLINENQKEKWDQILSFEEEKQRITKLIKKYFKKNLQNIGIVNVSDQYPEIFSVLKNQWTSWLESFEKTLSKENFSATSVVWYLYQKAQNNPKLMKLFYDTKPAEQRKQDILPAGQNNSDYYSLVEVWIRLYEVVLWISIQWWIDRQSKYDQIIWWILQWKDMDSFKIKDYPELKELSDFCREVNPNFEFDRVRISTKEVRNITEKQQSLSKFKMITLVTSFLLAGILWGTIGWYKISQNKQKKSKQELESKILKQALNATNISFWWTGVEYNPGENIKEKEKYLNDMTNSMYNFFCEVYWSSHNPDVIKSLIKNELLKIHTTYISTDWKIEQTRNIERFYRSTFDWSIIYINDFVINEFVPNNFVVLYQLDLNPIPYNRFLEYKSDFDRTIGLQWKISLSTNSSCDIIDENTTWLAFKTNTVWWWFVAVDWWRYSKEYLWTYYDYRDYNSYHFVKIKLKDDSTVVLASKGSYIFDASESQTYSLDIAKEAIKKLQTYRNKNM